MRKEEEAEEKEGGGGERGKGRRVFGGWCNFFLVYLELFLCIVWM